MVAPVTTRSLTHSVACVAFACRAQSTETANPNAWAIPAGMDFYAEAQTANFQLTVGVVEVRGGQCRWL